jgi:hypothetical protein
VTRAVAPLTEAEFQSWIVEHAKKAGWLVHHVARARVGTRWVTPVKKGWPDLTLVRPPRVVFLEVKRDAKQKLRPEQEVLLAQLQACPGVEAWVCSPDDYEQILDLLARPRLLPEGDYAGRERRAPEGTA